MASRTTRRTFLKTSAAGLGALALGAPMISFGAEKPALKVGVVTSLSGMNRLGGNLTKRGYDLWAEQINKKGGVEIGGERFPVEMFYGDAKSRPAAGADAAVRLIVQENVGVLFGPYTSGVTLAVQPIAAKYGVPMISGSAESPKLWAAHPEFNFGVIPAIDLTASKTIQTIIDTAEPRPQSAAVVGVNEAFSKATAEGFRQGVENAGIELTGYELVPRKADLTPVITKLKSQNPDVVAVGAHLSALINFVQTAKALNYRPKALLMHHGVTAAGFAQELGDAAENVFGLSVWTPTLPYEDGLFGTAEEYDALYYQRYDLHPDYTAAGCSASGLVLQDAAARFGKAPPWDQSARTQLKEAIEATDIDTFYGPIAFETEGDHYHNNTLLDPIVVQIKNGRPIPVAPQEAAEAEFVYPLPPLAS